MKLKKLLSILILALCAGCGVLVPDAETEQYLDRATGVTVSHLDEPAIFARAAPRLAAHVRDYFYIAPLEINRTGKREYYLWTAQWSSIDRPSQNASTTPQASSNISLVLDGKPVQLADAFDPDGGYREFQHPYAVPVDSARIAYWRVSRDLLSRISQTEAIVVELQQGETARRYRLWRGDPTLFSALLQNRPLPN
jgi:hypothetical protein